MGNVFLQKIEYQYFINPNNTKNVMLVLLPILFLPVPNYFKFRLRHSRQSVTLITAVV